MWLCCLTRPVISKGTGARCSAMAQLAYPRRVAAPHISHNVTHTIMQQLPHPIDCADCHALCCSISDDCGYLSIRAGMWAGYELSVTRALGHKHLSAYGVLCEPTVNTLTLQSDDTCLVSLAALKHTPASSAVTCITFPACCYIHTRHRTLSLCVCVLSAVWQHVFCSLSACHVALALFLFCADCGK
jgi:hypothetical protein